MDWKTEVKDRFSREQEASRWDRMYGEETKSLAEEHFRQRRDFTVDYILGRFDKATSICDLGCGAGPVTFELMRNGYRVVGVDYSLDMLENAQKRLLEGGQSDIALINSNGEQLPFGGEQFDLVVCLGVISYIENYADVIAEINRILRPGGTLIISYRSKYNAVSNDPLAFLRFLAKKTLVALGLRKPEGFRIGWPMREKEVMAAAEEKGFVFHGFKGIGFGTFSVGGWKPLKVETSIALSRKLSTLFDKLKLEFPYHAAADVHVLMFEKGR